MGCSHSFFFALVTLCRFALNLGFMERPLFIGAIWGGLTGDWTTTLSLTIFFELLWLDLFPVGTYIPPNAGFSLLLTLACSKYFNITSPALLAVPAALSLPAAMVGARFEAVQRRSFNRNYNKLILWARKPKEERGFFSNLPDRHSPGSHIAKGLLHTVVIHMLLFSVYLLVLIGTIRLISNISGHLPVIPGVTWVHFWCVGVIGCILSLRVRRTWILFAIACFCVTFLTSLL